MYDNYYLTKELLNGRHEWVLEYLYRANYGRLKKISFRILGDNFSTDDVVQDAFTYLWYKVGNRQIEFQSVFQIYKYLLIYVKGKSILIANYNKKYINTYRDEADKDLFDAIATAQKLRTLNGIIQENLYYIPTETRKVLIGLFLEEKSVLKLSLELGVSKTTIRVQKAAGVRMLKELVGTGKINTIRYNQISSISNKVKYTQELGFTLLSNSPTMNAEALSKLLNVKSDFANQVISRYEILKEVQQFNTSVDNN